MNKSRSKLILILISILSVGMLMQLPNMKANFDLEALFPETDEERQYFLEFREQFESENDYLAIALQHDGSLFDPDFLLQIDSLGKKLEQMPEVIRVHSLTSESFRLISPIGLASNRPLVRPLQSVYRKRDSIFVSTLPHFRHNLISENRQASCIYIQIEKGISGEEGDRFLERLQKNIASFSWQEWHLSGWLYSQRMQTMLMEKELWIFSSLALVMILLFLWLNFRSWWGVILPLLLVFLSGLWATGIMIAAGVEINIMTMLIPSIMFVVAVSDVIHLLSRYQEALAEGQARGEALRITVREIGLATFLTSLTTAFGFLTLIGAGIKPFQQFGLFAAIGVILAFGLTILLLPAILIHIPGLKLTFYQKQSYRWNKLMNTLFLRVIKNQRLILFLSGILLLLSLAGISRLEVQAFITDELNENVALQQDIEFFEKEFGGVRPFALNIEPASPDSNLFSFSSIRQMGKLQDWLESEYGLMRPYSLIGNLKAGWSSMYQGNARYYQLPESDRDLSELLNLVRLYGPEQGLYEVITEDGKRARISGSLHDLGSQTFARKNKELMDFAGRELSLLNIRVTGSAELIDRSHSIIATNMIQGLAIAVLVVSLLMGLLYRNWRMLIVALLPNLLPLLVIAGLMGWMGIGLKMSTSIVFSIAFGIAVDDSIHFLSKLNIERRKRLRYGVETRHALSLPLRRTFLSTGKAMIQTSVVLSAGFFIFILSDFNGTFLTGLFVSMTLVVALLADLFLLPVLFMWLHRSSFEY